MGRRVRVGEEGNAYVLVGKPGGVGYLEDLRVSGVYFDA